MCQFNISEFPDDWFDLDDTVIPNTYTYNKPMIDFVVYLTKLFAKRIPSLGTIAVFHQDIDLALGKETNPRTGELYGFGRDRFPDSLANTYRVLCENGFGVYDEGVAQVCRDIGMQAFDEANYKETGFSPGAEDVLNFLTKRKHRLVLVTKGDEWVQNKKIDALDLRRWFRDIFIVPQKTPEVYREIVSSLRDADRRAHRRQCDAQKTLVIGNSFHSDIKPGLDIGMSGIFVPCPTWKAERIDKGRLSRNERRRLIETPKIIDIISLYQMVAA